MGLVVYSAVPVRSTSVVGVIWVLLCYDSRSPVSSTGSDSACFAS